MKNTKRPWTEKENDLMLEYYHKLTQDALYAILPGRSRVEMDKQAAYLRRKNRTFKMRYE